jgi:hypothetical protein
VDPEVREGERRTVDGPHHEVELVLPVERSRQPQTQAILRNLDQGSVRAPLSPEADGSFDFPESASGTTFTLISVLKGYETNVKV